MGSYRDRHRLLQVADRDDQRSVGECLSAGLASSLVRRTAGYGALQSVADDAAYGRRCPPMLTSGTQTKLQLSGSSGMASARPTKREGEKRGYDFKLVFSELHPSREAAIDFSIARPGSPSTNRATASSASCCATPPRSCAPAGRRCTPSLSKDRYRRSGRAAP